VKGNMIVVTMSMSGESEIRYLHYSDSSVKYSIPFPITLSHCYHLFPTASVINSYSTNHPSSPAKRQPKCQQGLHYTSSPGTAKLPSRHLPAKPKSEHLSPSPQATGKFPARQHTGDLSMM